MSDSLVTCPICQFTGKTLVSHVRKHGLTSKEFNAKYPCYPLLSKQTRQLIARVGTEKGGRPKGIPMSDSQKKWLSDTMRGERAGFYGKSHTLETKKRMSENHADFTGDKNPYKKAVTNDPTLTRRTAEKRKVTWQFRKADKKWWKRYIEKRSLLTSQSHIDGKLNSYGYGHKSGYFTGAKLGTLYYRSSYERTFLQICEELDFVTSVVGVKFKIPFEDGEGITRNYISDYLVNNSMLVEIKPEGFLGSYRNPYKFIGALRYASTNGWSFIILTETELSNSAITENIIRQSHEF